MSKNEIITVAILCATILGIFAFMTDCEKHGVTEAAKVNMQYDPLSPKPLIKREAEATK